MDSNKQPTPTAPKTSDKKKRSFVRTLIYLIWGGFFIGLLSFFLLFWGISNGMFGELPSFIELESPKNSLASEVYSSDSVLLGKFYIENRSNVSYDEISPNLTKALVATEDVRFKEHSGIDFRSLMRAVIRMGKDGGASTITQQLAKNLFHGVKTHSKMERIKQKFKEWVIAVRLERGYTKDEIMTMYLNTVPFSNNAHGIKSASKVYFGKQPSELEIQEAAVLIGMLKASTKFNPIRNPELSKRRRNVVLGQMAKYNKLTSAEVDSIQQLPLVTNYSQQDHNEGLGTYFREYIKATMKEWSKNQVKVDGTSYDVFRDGLKIYTTINSKMQAYAEVAAGVHMRDLQKQFYDHWGNKRPWDYGVDGSRMKPVKIKAGEAWHGMNSLIYRAAKNTDRYRRLKANGKLSEKEIEKVFNDPVKMEIFSWEGQADLENHHITYPLPAVDSSYYYHEIDTILTPIDSIKHYKMLLHTGMMITDPQTGHIRAWVGGINHKHFKYDNVRIGSKRQVGSTFKPFVYTLAVQSGWSPCRKVPNVPVTFEKFNNWTPKNSGSLYNGRMITLKTGLAHSINRVTAYLMKYMTSPDAVIQLAQKMGIESHMDPYPSICLGTPDISVYEMTGAYSTFANKGFYTQPYPIIRIEDKSGTPLKLWVPRVEEVMSEQTAYAMISLLKGVVNNGTARRLRWKYKLEAEIAGKTGTTNNNSDGWFMGFTPDLVGGTWSGGDEKQIRFKTTRLGAGSNMALPVFAEFMKRVYADSSLNILQTTRFEKPYRMSIETDCSKYAEKLPSVADPGSPEDTTSTQTDDNYDYNDEFDN
ncbi:MAG: penicillin-binding protein 1A [Chitinophagales bacterium]